MEHDSGIEVQPAGAVSPLLSFPAWMRWAMAPLTAIVAMTSSAAAELSPSVRDTRHRAHKTPLMSVLPCVGSPVEIFWHAPP